MIVHKNLYLGDNIKSPVKYLNKLNKGKFLSKFYLAVLTEEGCIEIYNSYIFLQKYYRNQSFTLIALAKSKDTLFEYIRRLTEISVRKYQCFNPLLCINELDLFDIDFLYEELQEETE